MQQNSNYTLLFPTAIDWESFDKAQALPPFSDETVEWLNALSSLILKDRESRLYPDVVTFGFFCRKANILKLKAQYVTDELRLGRGTVFHIAPGNVPVNFAYTFVAGMLAGNKNIVRVSSKPFPQVDIIIRHIHELAKDEKYADFSKRLALVRYDRTSEATRDFSAISQARVIWGGDRTISNIRQYPIPPRGVEVCFADRYSMAVLRPSEVVAADDKTIQKLAEDFYNDTYLFDQNACSAPHLVCWLKDGQQTEAKERFWSAVHDLVKKKYDLQSVLAVDKLTAFYRQAANMPSHKVAMPDNFVVRCDIDNLPKHIDEFRCAGGYFTECDIEALEDIAPIVTVKYQTLAYFGFSKEELANFVTTTRLNGFDRIVPVGHTTDFDLTWDGYNLIQTLSRAIVIQ